MPEESHEERQEPTLDTSGELDTTKDQTAATAQSHPATPILEKKRRKNKRMVILLAILLVVVISGCLYWFFFRDDNTSPAATQTNTNTVEQTEEVAVSKKADEVYYFYAEKDDGPYSLYRRSVNGGERTEIFKLESGRPSALASNGTTYLFAVDNVLWVGTFDGSTPKAVATFREDSTVLDAVYADKDEFYISVTTDYAEQEPAIFRFNADGTNQQTVYTSAEVRGAFFIEGYGSGNLAIRPSCWGCDGANDIANTQTLSLKDDSMKDESPFDYFEGKASPDYSGYRLLTDYKTLYYFKPTEDKSIAVESTLGYNYEYYVGAPYTLVRVNTATDAEASLVGNLGKKELVSYGGGSSKYPQYYKQGFFNQGVDGTAYFANIAYLPTADGTTTLHEFPTNENIQFPLYASDSELVVGAAKDPATPNGDVPVYFVDIAKRTSSKFMTATATTTVFVGVSLK